MPANNCKTVRNIIILLEVCNVEINFVTNFYAFNIIGGKVATNHAHINMYFISIAFHSGFLGSFNSIFMLVLTKFPDLPGVFRYYIRRNTGGVMRFPNGWEIK